MALEFEYPEDALFRDSAMLSIRSAVTDLMSLGYKIEDINEMVKDAATPSEEPPVRVPVDEPIPF